MNQILSDSELHAATSKSANALLDHIYEHGTIDEGVSKGLAVVYRAVEAAILEKLADKLRDAERFNLSEQARNLIGLWLTDTMDAEVVIGGNSVTMPDEFVEIAVWLTQFEDAAITAEGRAIEAAHGITGEKP